MKVWAGSPSSALLSTSSYSSDMRKATTKIVLVSRRIVDVQQVFQPIPNSTPAYHCVQWRLLILSMQTVQRQEAASDAGKSMPIQDP